jgi:hypothetical protein
MKGQILREASLTGVTKQCAEPANERFQDRQVLTKAEETVLEEKKFRRTIGVLDVYLFI